MRRLGAKTLQGAIVLALASGGCGGTTIKTPSGLGVSNPARSTSHTDASTEGAAAGTSSAASPLSSVQAFSQTVYPLATQWCGTCHATSQSPFFAKKDLQGAHTAVLTGQKVDFSHPENSRLVLRLTTDQHNCPKVGCAAAGAKMLKAVQTWAAAITATTNQGPQLPTTQALKLASATAATIAGVNPAGVLAFQATDFTVTAPMQKVALASASSGFVINTPATEAAVTAALQATGDTALGTATVTFNVAAAGTYQVTGLVNGADAGSSAFFLSMDAGTLTPWVFAPTAAAYTFATAAPAPGGTPTTFNLTAGSHTLKITQSLPAAAFDKIVVTNNPTFDPATAQPTTRTAKVLTYDLASLTKIKGAKLTVEVSDYSANAYLFENPTLVLPSGSLHVANLRLLINGDFSAQNATYTAVDQVVQAPGGVLSTAALVAVKEQGDGVDQFSFAFGTLAAP